ncbi:MAG: MinD/ParA family protein, partial [Candidatus Odinarchaeota archaeon]
KDKLSKFSDHLRRLQNKKGYDFVIIDTRAGKHGELFLPVPLSHVVLLTTRLDGHSIKKTMKLYEEFYLDFPSLKMFFIENQVPLLEDESKVDRTINTQIEKNNEIWHGFIDKYKEKRFIEVFTIPLSIEIAYTVMGNAVVDPASGNPLTKYIEDIARKLLNG